MDKTTHTPEILPTHGPRWERNRKYYLKNTYQPLRSTLLHNIKSSGITPSEVTKVRPGTTLARGAGLLCLWTIAKEKTDPKSHS